MGYEIIKLTKRKQLFFLKMKDVGLFIMIGKEKQVRCILQIMKNESNCL